MKRVLMALVVAILMMGLAAESRASLSEGDNYSLTSSLVSFYLVDWDTTQFDDQIIMTAGTLGAPITSFKYSFDNSTWSNFIGTNYTTGTATISVNPSNHTQLMYLKHGEDQIADMIFQSWTTNSGSNTTPNNLDLFTGLVVHFDSSDYTNITFLTNVANDKFSIVPIPGAIWLFAPALAGLAGLRKRFKI